MSILTYNLKPIRFGTDGWRGTIGDDFTFERVVRVAAIAALVLQATYGEKTSGSRTIIVGYDRRFMAEDFARAAAEAISAVGFNVLLSCCYAPTPAFSWAAKAREALGAIVMTASHNPGQYLGLKVKGAFGGSVSPDVTRLIEARLSETISKSSCGSVQEFDPWPSYCETLRTKVDLAAIQSAIDREELTIIVDAMHGAAAGGLERILEMPIFELNQRRDPLFGGQAPEPLPCHLTGLQAELQQLYHSHPLTNLAVGLAFDGDCDRLAAMDRKGNFLSSQILIPILTDHLVTQHGYTGEVVKTLSGVDSIPLVAALHGLKVYETPIGYKYIAERMLAHRVLLGGEESGGIGYGHHIPERDALLSALYVLEAIVKSQMDLSQRYQELQHRVGYVSTYDRIDLPLENMEVRSRLLQELESNPPSAIAGCEVVNCQSIDGYKFRLSDRSWLLIRFSGTEPVLRLYCEAATKNRVLDILLWAQNWAHFVSQLELELQPKETSIAVI